MNHSLKIVGLALIACALIALPLSAANVYWTGGNGAYTSGGNWSSGTVPYYFDHVYIQNGGTVNIGSPTSTNYLEYLEVGGNGTDGGRTPGAGNMTQTGGTVNVGYFGIGFKTGSSPMSTYTMTGGTLYKQTPQYYYNWDIGNLGKGTLAMSGTATVNNLSQEEVWIGVGASGLGILTMADNAVFNTTHWVQLGREGGEGYAKLSGNAVFNAEYHFNNSNWTTIGGSYWGGAKGTGTMTLSGSSALNIKAGGLRIGYGGNSNTDTSVGQMIINDNAVVNADRAIFVGDTGAYTGYGVMTMNGGVINHKTFYDQGDRNAIILGQWFGNGVWNQLGGSVLNNSRIVLGDGDNGSSSGAIMNLKGGVVEATYLDTYGSGKGILNFNGGTLKAKYDQPNLIRGNITPYVYSGGAIIDTNSYNVSITEDLIAPAGDGVSSIAYTAGTAVYTTPPVVQIAGNGKGATAVATLDASGHLSGITITNPGVNYSGTVTAVLVGGNPSDTTASLGAISLAANVSGGLTVRGGGNLSLFSANTYTGPTNVENGTLTIGSGASFLTSAFNVGAKGNLVGIPDTTISPISVASGGTVTPGNPTNTTTPYGTLATTGLTLSDGAVLAITGNAGAYSTIQVYGDVAGPASGKTIVDLKMPADSLPSGSFDILNYSGNWTNSTNVLPVVDSIGTNSVSVAVVDYAPSGVITATIADISGNHWNGPGSNYSSSANWLGGVPNGTDARALFAGATPTAVNLDSGLTGNLTLSSLILNNAAGSYTLGTDASKSLVMDSTIAANAQINDMAGSHTIGVNVVLNKPTRIQIADSGVTDPYVLTMSGVISGSNGITLQQGPGTLRLTNAANTYTGPTVMKYSNTNSENLPDYDSCGTLEVASLANGGANSSIGKSGSSADNLVLAGTFKYTGSTDVSSDRGFTIGSYLYFDTGARNVAMSGQVKGERAGGFYKYGTGTLTLSGSGANTAYDDFRVTEGTLTFNGGANSTWNIATSGHYAYAWRGAHLCVGDQNTGNAEQGISSTATMNIQSGTFDIGGAVQVGFRGQYGSTSTLNMSGGKIDCIYFDVGNGYGEHTANVNLSGSAYVVAHDNAWIGDQSGTTSNMSMTDNSVFESGKYVVVGYEPGVTATMTMDLNSQMTIQSGASESADANDYLGLAVGYSGATGTLTVKGNAKITTGPYMPTTIGMYGDSRGYLNIQGNANLMIGNLRVGDRGNAVGVVKQTGGSIGSMNSNTVAGTPGSPGNEYPSVVPHWAIGGNVKADGTAWSTTSYGYYKQSGGTLSPGYDNSFIVGYTSAGIFEQTGGTLYNDYRVRVGELASAVGVANFSGTAVVQVSNPLLVWTNSVGVNGYGVMNVSGNAQFLSNFRITVGQVAGSTGIVNLGAVGSGGGTISANWLQAGAGTKILNFHGGTFKANSSLTYYPPEGATDNGWIGFDSLVYGEGANFDTNGNSVTIYKNLLAPTGRGVQTISLTNGGEGYVAPPVVKISGGAGSGATANAVIDEGTGLVTGFVITNPGTGYAASDVLTVQLIGGGATTAATATISAANLAANVNTGGITKTGLGTLTLSGVNTYGGDTNVDQGTLTFTTALNTPNATVNVATGATLNATSIVADTLNIGDVGQANAVPEPSTFVLLALAGVGILAAWLRRK
jgi:autotransporter-associated beta strand protein